MKLFRNRFIIGGLCIIAAAFFAFVVLPRLNASKDATTMVVHASRDIKMGAKLEDKDIEIVEVGSYNLPKNVLLEKELAVGTYANVPILAGDLILDTKISGVKSSSLLEKALAEKKQLVTVSLSGIAAGVGGHLQAGDTVAVRYFMDEEKISEYDEELETYVDIIIPSRVVDDPVLSRVTLYAVENANAEAITIDEADGTQIADRAIPKTATLIVTDEQLQAILLAEYTGKIHLVFVGRGGV